MQSGVRRFALTVHVLSSVGWCGALAVFLAHAVAVMTSNDQQIVRAVYVAMGVTAWVVILPLSIASLVSGLAQALGTAWGLFRHYWVVFKLLLTLVATVVLLLKLGPISSVAEAAAQVTFAHDDLLGSRTSLVVHSIGGLALLIASAALAIYKPKGRTRYGWREEHASSSTRNDVRPPEESTPTWVKIIGLLVIVLILLVGVMILGGRHGPASHASVGVSLPRN